MMGSVNLTREERETTRLGSARVRVGYRPAAGQPRKYFRQEGLESWTVSARTMGNGQVIYSFQISSSSRDENGEEYHTTNIHIFDKGSEPMVIIDYQNYYEEWIDAERMTLDAYLNSKEEVK